MIIGLIIAAGKQTRFESEVPKALVRYKGKPLLEHNIENMKTVCDKVYVVVNLENQSLFDQYNTISIRSGNGCGDAVLKALLSSTVQAEDTIIVQWGDTLHTPRLYHKLVTAYIDNKRWIIPCVQEDSPYVQIVPANGGVKVLFSKYGDAVTSGYHDLSVFCGNAGEMTQKLLEFADQYLINSPGRLYNHPHNNELQFLDVFNETNIPAAVLDMGDYKDFSFNTVAQFISVCEENIR